MSFLSAKGLNVDLGKWPVLHDVAFDCGRGELLGLIGPNGAGKTTLLRALGGLIPFRGTVDIDGKALPGLSRRTLARMVAYVAQGHVVHWPVAAEDAVRLGRLPHRGASGDAASTDAHAVSKAMERADVSQFAGRNVLSLSEGERARVLLARALAVEAPILLVDEPIASLDPYHQLQIMEVLRAYAHEGALVIAVLHDLTLAARFCDRLILLDGGRVAGCGDPDSVLTEETLRQAYRVRAARGEHGEGRYIIPWDRTDAGSAEGP